MRVLSSLVIVAMFLAGAGTVQACDKEKRGEHRKKLLEKFDKDGDGKLSDAEKQAAREAHGERGKGDRPGGKRRHKKLLERFDKDGDGKLSDAEKEAAKKAWQEHKNKKRDGDKKPEPKSNA